MSRIHVLDSITVDKIAAGEVIERPASIVKELVENAIDAGADNVTVEIKDGGISLIRVSDNGSGILRDDVRNAFLRHSTSKIRTAEDLDSISSLGFRGEALSSIAAVTKTELVTKTKDDTFGTRYIIEGGKEVSIEDTGAPDGTTFLIRQLFYNVPARRKFLRTATTEASHVQDLLMHLALSHPDTAIKFISGNQEKLRTSGSGRLKDVIYSIYGREVASNLIDIDYEKGSVHITGFLGKPVITRSNRNFENFFVNGRYIKSSMISKSVEEGYADFLMQHKFPFAVLHFEIDGNNVDVNVHPTKMELRFSNQREIYDTVYEAVHRTLLEPELIQVVDAPDPVRTREKKEEKEEYKSPFLLKQSSLNARSAKPVSHVAIIDDSSVKGQEHLNGEGGAATIDMSMQTKPIEQPKPSYPPVMDKDYFMQKMKERVRSAYEEENKAKEAYKNASTDNGNKERDLEVNNINSQNANAKIIKETSVYGSSDFMSKTFEEETLQQNMPSFLKPDSLNTNKDDLGKISLVESEPKPIDKVEDTKVEKPQQLDLFEENLLKREIKAEYKIIGQVFDTYWLVEFHDSLYIIDQHAAHERVLYEKTMKTLKTREFTTQYVSPPIILSLSMKEADLLKQHIDMFTNIGFEIEPFGGDEYAVRGVPGNLFGIAKKDLLLEMIDSLEDGITSNMAPDLINEKVASMSCKAAVKGNNRLSAMEVDALIGELLTLENPYHCPHGRPTIIAMTKRELEKKFKRIV